MKTLIAETIRPALENPFVSPKELSKTVGDTTVQEKNITYPTDAKLLSRAIIQLAKHVKQHDVKVRQHSSHKAKKASVKHSRYAHAKQYNCMNREIRDLKNWLGRLVRDIERNKGDRILSYEFQQLLSTSKKLLTQE
ncbi:MAG: IS5/IS1182 family transposase, partial [Planctomycetaceae bacterium]|nr:IS5/IS1182 family transposase [Planctomycetaceae bacterium]